MNAGERYEFPPEHSLEDSMAELIQVLTTTPGSRSCKVGLELYGRKVVVRLEVLEVETLQ